MWRYLWNLPWEWNTYSNPSRPSWSQPWPLFMSMSMSKISILTSKYISFFSKHWNWPLTHSLVGNVHKTAVIVLSEEAVSIWAIPPFTTSTTRFLRPQSHPYPTTTLHDSISRYFSPSCTYGMEIDQFLVFWLFTSSLFRQVMSRF